MFYYLFIFFFHFTVFELEITQFHGNVHAHCMRVHGCSQIIAYSNDSRHVTVENDIILLSILLLVQIAVRIVTKRPLVYTYDSYTNYAYIILRSNEVADL